MAASVEHKFKKGFLLDEERIRKLTNLISQRLGKAEPPIEHRFKVTRADSYSYETTNVEDIINEDHADWRRIIGLQARASKDKEFDFALTFTEDGTSLKINGDDRDQVYLLFSDLKEYLGNEVNTCLHISYEARRLIPMLLPVLFMIGVLIISTWNNPRSPSQEEIQVVLDSATIENKLDFLIASENARVSERLLLLPSLFIMAILIILIATEFMNKLFGYFFPSNLFLFGSQKQKYEKRQRLIAKVLWGVLITFIVSVVAGLVVWKITVE